MGGDSVGQREEAGQPRLFVAGALLHLLPTLAVGRRGADADADDVDKQVVPVTPVARVSDGGEVLGDGFDGRGLHAGLLRFDLSTSMPAVGAFV